MKAWRKLKPDSVSTTASASAPAREIIVISTKEETAMQKMKEALSNIVQLLEQNAANQAKLTADTQRISSQIESTFSEYVAKITERAMALQEQLRAESKQQTDALQQQQENLQKLKESVESGLESQNAMLIDTKMDRKKREIKIEEITSTLLSVMDDDVKENKAPDLVFASDDDTVAEFVSTIGSLSERPDPPSLTVSGISQNAATIRFQSEYDSVIYSFRYRRETGGDDDEKESEWIEKVLDNGVNQFKLNGLQQKSKYQLCGKLVSNMMSSITSDIVLFQTLDYGPFEWDSTRKHSSINLSDNNRTLTSTETTAYRTVVSKNKVSLGSIKSLEWEITIREMPKNHSMAWLLLGFCNSSAVDQIRLDANLGDSQRPNECVFCVCDTYLSRYEKGGHTKFDAKWKAKHFKNGERILFKFENAVCTMYLNESEIGILKEGLADEIHLAACPFRPMTLETTKFQIISKT